MLAIICGGGKYPLEIAKCCLQNGTKFTLAFIDGSYDPNLDWPDVPAKKFSIGQIGGVLSFLEESKVSQIIFAGFVERPNLFDISLDSVGTKWLMKLGMGAFSGDDGLLKNIAALFADEGFDVIDPSEFIKSLTIKSNVLTIKKPSKNDLNDVAKGVKVLSDLSKHDIGQAVIIENGLAIGIECVEGTDKLIIRSKDIKKCQRGGVLLKVSKNNQDLRFDMPTIGLQTVVECYNSGLNGIAIEQENCLFLNQEESIKFANEHDMFIIGVKKEKNILQCTNEYL